MPHSRGSRARSGRRFALNEERRASPPSGARRAWRARGDSFQTAAPGATHIPESVARGRGAALSFRCAAGGRRSELTPSIQTRAPRRGRGWPGASFHCRARAARSVGATKDVRTVSQCYATAGRRAAELGELAMKRALTVVRRGAGAMFEESESTLIRRRARLPGGMGLSGAHRVARILACGCRNFVCVTSFDRKGFRHAR